MENLLLPFSGIISATCERENALRIEREMGNINPTLTDGGEEAEEGQADGFAGVAPIHYCSCCGVRLS